MTSCKGWCNSVWFVEEILNNLGISRDYYFGSEKDKANMAHTLKRSRGGLGEL